MVRPGFTNVFQTKTAEDLENRIVYVLSEQVTALIVSLASGPIRSLTLKFSMFKLISFTHYFYTYLVHQQKDVLIKRLAKVY